MALTGDQIALIAEAVREPFATVASAIAAEELNSAEKAAERDLLIVDINAYAAVRNSFVRFRGDGVDFDNERKREAIFYRMRRLLGLPFVVFSLSVEMMELFEIEVGENFA